MFSGRERVGNEMIGFPVTRSNFAGRRGGVMKPVDRSHWIASRLSRRSSVRDLESVKVEQAAAADRQEPRNFNLSRPAITRQQG